MEILKLCVLCIVHLLVNKSSKWKVQIVESLTQVFWSSVTSFLLDPNILFGFLFLDTLNLCSSIVMRDEDPHCCKTTGVTDGQFAAACNLQGIHMKRGVCETEYSCNKSISMKWGP